MTTSIKPDAHQILVFNIQIQDNSAFTKFHGRIYGDTVYRDDTATQTVTVDNSGDTVKLTFGGLNTVAGSYNIWGQVRHH